MNSGRSTGNFLRCANTFQIARSRRLRASATQQVRHDIVSQLQLRAPDKYLASFHRPNLRYVVRQCDARTQARMLLDAVRSYAGENVIIYSPTINRVEETVAFLKANGVKAVGYHGKMDAEMRRRNQEKWMSDEVPVLVGTVAFGLGINKAAVRAVIHLSLPKSIEQYYQEAGARGARWSAGGLRVAVAEEGCGVC